MEQFIEQLRTFGVERLPDLVIPIAILLVGWIVALVLSSITRRGLARTTLDERLAPTPPMTRALATLGGMDKVLGKQRLSALLGFIVYVLVLIPVAIGALGALKLAAITEPASDMLEAFFAAVPAIFGATLVLAVAYAVGAMLASVVARLLNGIGFDTVLEKIGFARKEVAGRFPSQLIGQLVMVSVIYFAALEGARLLGFDTINAIGSEFALFAGHILLGLLIFAVGLYLARLAADAVRSSDLAQARVVATVTRISILGLAAGMALRQMGVANEIVELAFGLLLGAMAVAFAIAFGLGGRDAASRMLEDMRARLSETPTPQTGDRAAS